MLMHKVVEGKFGGSEKGLVVLFGTDGPAITYSGMVLVSGAGGYRKVELPQPVYTWSIEEPKAIFFANADSDSDPELFVIGRCLTGIGADGAKPFSRTRVYDWNGTGFTHLESVSQEIGMRQGAASIRRDLPVIVKRVQARFQPLDVEALNATLVAHKDANTPLQVIAALVDPFGEMLSRTVSVKAKTIESPDSLDVEVTDDGYADDSVRGAQFRFKLIKNVEGAWRVSTASKGWRCHAGRGSQTFSSKPCI
jgi:hypothetical protein